MHVESTRKSVQKSQENSIWEGLELHLGGLWDAPGSLLVAFGRLSGALGTFKTTLFPSIGPRLAPRGLRDRFGVDLEWIWEGFGRDLHHFEHVVADSGHLW